MEGGLCGRLCHTGGDTTHCWFFFILFHVYPRQGPVRRLPEQPGQSAELRGTAVATEVISRAVLSVTLPSSTNFSITYGREAAP